MSRIIQSKILNRLSVFQEAVIAFIVFVLILRIGYIMLGGEINKEFINYKQYDISKATTLDCINISQDFKCDNTTLDSIEIMFDNVADDGIGYIDFQIYSGENLMYQTKISVSNIINKEWKNIYVNAKVFNNKNYHLFINASDECTQVPQIFVVKDKFAPEIVSSYENGANIDGQVVINYGFNKKPSIFDRIVTASIWIIGGIAMLFLVIKYNSYKEYLVHIYNYICSFIGKQMFWLIAEIISCMVIIGCSGIEFQWSTIIILIIISLISSVDIERKNVYIDKLVDAIWKKFLLVLLYLYAAFALVGQRIWIYPLDKDINIAEITVFFVTVVWFVPVVKSILYYIEKTPKIIIDDGEKNGNVRFAVIIALCLLVPAGYNLFIYNPGISSVDTAICMIDNAKHLHGMLDWHPFYYCLLLRIISMVWDSTYMVIIIQYVFYSYVFVELFLYLRKNIKDKVLYFAAFLIGINASNYIQINTIWKDIPYTLSVLWLFVIVVKLVLSDTYRGKYIYIELVFAMVGTYLYRKNGVVTFIIVSICLIPVIKKNVNVLISIIVSIICIGLLKGPVYSYFEVVPSGETGMYIGLGQDILGVYYNNGEVSEDTLKMITNMTNYNNAEYSYNPTWSNQSYNVNVTPTRFVINYLDTFIHNPVIMARTIIDREDALWDIFKGEECTLGCVNYTRTMNNVEGYEVWDEHYPDRKYVSLYNEISAINEYKSNSQWISAIEWRCGLFSFLGMVTLSFLLLRIEFRNVFILISPMLGHILSLLLSTGWADFRYFWPMNLLNMSFVFIMFSLLNDKRYNNEICS